MDCCEPTSSFQVRTLRKNPLRIVGRKAKMSIHMNTIIPRLETVIYREEYSTYFRPSSVIKNGKLKIPHEMTDELRNVLVDNKNEIVEAAKCVGRIELNGRHQGTGWNIFYTFGVSCSHVVRDFVEDRSKIYFPGISDAYEDQLTINYSQNLKRKIVDIVYYCEMDDVAIFRVDKPVPFIPIKFHFDRPIAKQVVFIGFPGPGANPGEVRTIRNPGKKCVSAGYVQAPNNREFDNSMYHDASTSGGSSGSLGFDVESGMAVCMHTGCDVSRSHNRILNTSAFFGRKYRKLIPKILGKVIERRTESSSDFDEDRKKQVVQMCVEGFKTFFV